MTDTHNRSFENNDKELSENYHNWIVKFTIETKSSLRWLIVSICIFIFLILSSAFIPEVFLPWAILFGVTTICIYVYFQISIVRTEIASVTYFVTTLIEKNNSTGRN
jgi:hypothetical protein